MIPILNSDLNLTADGLQASIGGFTLYALAAGHAEPAAEGRHRITVTKCWVFAHDSFDFDEDENFFYWSCQDKAFTFDPLKGLRPGYFNIFDADFRSFRERHGYGRDFAVLSNLHEVMDFKGMSFECP